jgi:glycosyltransferase involved in cell wall biosynthesis
MNKIVCAPIHYVLDSQHSGSEFGWSYKIFGFLNSKFPNDVHFVTGGARGINSKNVVNLRMFDPENINLSLLNIFIFYFKTYQAIVKISNKIGNRFILHHVLPFSLDNSFNLYALTHKCKFILGPIQTPLTFKDKDLDTSSARGYKLNKNSWTPATLIQTLIKPIIRTLSKLTLLKADKIICTSQISRKMVLDRGVSESKIIIISPGIDTSIFTPNTTPKNNNEIVFLSAGYLLERKGVDLVIRAFSLALKSNLNIKLLIVGDGPQKNNLEKLVDNLMIRDFVSFTGNVPNDQIHNFYQKSDVFVSMSRSDSFPSMYLEAMSSGLPVIASDNDGSKSMIVDNENGYIVEQENVEMLSQKILFLSKNQKEIIRLGNSARNTAVNKYDWKKSIFPKFLTVYEELFD